MKYDNVILCHEGNENKVNDLLEIASASGSRLWDFNVWKHSIRSIAEDELATYRAQRFRVEEVPA
jgi:hypothetical protein